MGIAVFVLLVVLAALIIFKGKLKEIMGEEILKWATIGVAAAAAVCTLILIIGRLQGYYGSFIWMIISLVMGVLLAGFLFNVLRLNSSLSSLSFNFGKLSLGEQLMAGGSAVIVLMTLYLLLRALFLGHVVFSGRNISYIIMSLGAVGFLIATLSGMTAAKSIPQNQLMIAAAALVALELIALITNGFILVVGNNWDTWLETGKMTRNVFQFSRLILMLGVVAAAVGPFMPNNKKSSAE